MSLRTDTLGCCTTMAFPFATAVLPRFLTAAPFLGDIR